MNYSYRNSIVQIIYSRCKSIQLKLGTLVVECPACDRKDKYIGIGRKERKKIKALLKTITFGGEKNEGTIKDHLCPRCTQELDKGIYICKNCNTEFKSKKMARILSIFLPGGGYFYTRHFFIGFINSLIEISLLFFAGLYCYRMLNNIENNVLFFTICIVSLICEKVISVIHSNHFINEFIPKTKTIYSSI